MVFKKKSHRRGRRSGFMARARHSKSSGLSTMNVLLAGAVYGVARPYVAAIIPDYSIGPVSTDNLAIAGLGYLGSRKSGFIKALGLIAMGGEAGIVAAKGIGNVTGVQGQSGYVYN